jgi:hypothetical protein
MCDVPDAAGSHEDIGLITQLQPVAAEGDYAWVMAKCFGPGHRHEAWGGRGRLLECVTCGICAARMIRCEGDPKFDGEAIGGEAIGELA